MTARATSDLILVGGGLANGLVALRLASSRPGLAITIVEAGPTLGGNHTWSFHESDISPAQAAWLAPLIEHRWPSYEVVFPNLSRHVPIGYRSITSRRFHKVLSALSGLDLRLGATVAELSPHEVRLDSGDRITASAVIDGRGPEPSAALAIGFQKFLGREVVLGATHRLSGPILMDATVEQIDGYRFAYVLPLATDRLLIEDTYYAGGADLDAATLRLRIHAYAAARGWTIKRVVREEAGVLPITLGGDIDRFWAEAPAGLPRSGLRAGLFHPTTGYSLPDAVRLADLIAALPDLTSAALDAAIRAHARARWRRQGYFRALNRMLFRAGRPEERYRVMERFYTLSDTLIRRFYAGEITTSDKVRLLAGRPPVPLVGALRALMAAPAR